MLLIAFVVIMIPGLFCLWVGVSSMEMHGNINLCKELRRVTCWVACDLARLWRLVVGTG